MFEQCSLNLLNARTLICLASGTDSHVQTINIMIFTKSRNCNIGNFPMFIKSENQHQSHVWAMQPESFECETSGLLGLRIRQACSNHQNHDFHKIKELQHRKFSYVHKIWGSTSKSCLSNAAWISSMRYIWFAWPQKLTAMFKLRNAKLFLTVRLRNWVSSLRSASPNGTRLQEQI